MSENKTAFLAIKAVTEWAGLGVTGVAVFNVSILGKKSRDEGISGRKQGSVCVCSHSTCLTYDSALCLQGSAMI